MVDRANFDLKAWARPHHSFGIRELGLLVNRGFRSTQFRVVLTLALTASAVYATAVKFPAVNLPVEVSEEAKIMCSNSVILQDFSAVKLPEGYYIKANCANGDVVHREIVFKKGKP